MNQKENKLITTNTRKNATRTVLKTIKRTPVNFTIAATENIIIYHEPKEKAEIFFSRPSPKAGRELQTALNRIIRDENDEDDP